MRDQRPREDPEHHDGERRDHLAKKNCALLFTLIPDKASLYPEYVPNWSRPLQPVSRMDQLMDHLEAHTDLNLLDLRPVMNQAKAEGVYFLHQKTDSHWTQFGAYLAAREIIRNLAVSFPAMEARPIDPGSIEYVLGAGGDLARMLGLEYERMEERVCLQPLDGFRARMVDDLSPPPRLLPPYQKPVVMMQEDRPDLPRAIVYGDSFSRTSLFHQFLSDAFHRAVFADVRHADFDPDFIEREYPDVVILIIVARRLQLDPPAQAFTRNW